jgi:serine/threonine protein kinase
MAVATVDEYLSALEKSKLLAAEQLAQAQNLAGASSDATAFARALARENLISRWQASTLLDLGRRAKLRMGKYQLISPLGKGGMGKVFLAEHVTMNRRVALKIVPRSIDKDPASLDRFFAEARAIAALDHPNIVQAYSVDNEMDRYFIVMEFVDGDDLQRLVEASGPLEIDRAANYIRQAAEGLAHAHARNLVHCDIKPSNLLVNNLGVVKILDLGLARLNQSNEPRGEGEPVLGTVDYMSPEQGVGGSDFDHRADIYSLGCTLYFLLTGHPPFPEGTLLQRIAKHQTQEPRDILAERPGTPVKLAEICRRMMAKQPSNRYQSMQEVSAALAPLLGGNGKTSLPAPRAVKAIEETPTNGSGVAGDWLAAITGQSDSPSVSVSGSVPSSKAIAGRSPGKSDKQIGKGRAASGRVTATAGMSKYIQEAIAWFNTPQRRILGAAGVALTLAVVVGLAAMPLLLVPSQPQHASPSAGAKASDKQTTLEKPKTLEDEVGRPSDLSPAKKQQMTQEPERAPTPIAKTAPTTAPPPVNNPETGKNAATSTPEVKPAPPAPIKSPATPEVAVVPSSGEKGGAAAPPIVTAKQVALDGLPAAIDLPPTKDSDAISLGKVESVPKPDLAIQLLGGETIGKGSLKFELSKDGDAPSWSARMIEKNKDDAKIARVFLEGGDCKFEWAADARDRASLMRYCGLRFSSGNDKHVTVLTAPKSVPPLVVDLEATATRPRRLGRDFALPDPSLLRMRILPLDNSMPKYQVKVTDKQHPFHVRGKPQEMTAGDTIAVKGRAAVILEKEKTPPVTCQVAFDTRGKDVSLDVQAACEVSGETFQFNSGAVQLRAARVNGLIMASESSQGRNVRNPPTQQMIKAWKSASNDYKALETLINDLRKEVAIPFSIYVVAGAADDNTAPKLVIFQSSPDDSNGAASQRKNKGRGPKCRGAATAGDASAR